MSEAPEVQKPKRGSLALLNRQNEQLAPPLGKRYKKSQIQEVIEKSHGMTSTICHALDCTHQQFYVYLRKHQDLKKLQEECRQGMIDKAEAVLMHNLDSENELIRQKAAEFVLNRLGAARGWGQNSTIVSLAMGTDSQTSTVRAIFGIDQGNSQDEA